MNPQKTKINQPCKAVASLLFVALLTFINSASAQLTVTGSSQTGSVPFTPAWTPATGGLLDNLAPTIASGDFSGATAFGSPGTAGSAANLTTVGESLEVRSYPGEGNLELCGNAGGVGNVLVYTLTNSAPVNGYNITNITVYGSWVNNGRDAQDYTISYSTVSAPTTFNILTGVHFDPNAGGGVGAATRVVINDASGGLIAANVYALQFDFTTPGAQNAAVGYNAITVQGVVATGPTNSISLITYSNEIVASGAPPTWTIETNSLIAGMAPSAFTGFTGGSTSFGTTGTPALTDGTFGNVDNGASYCWGGGNSTYSAQTLTYTLTNSVNGSDLTNIVVYSGWSSATRDGQFYNISYSTVSAPTTFIPLQSIIYNPNVSGISANRVAITTTTGAPLAKNVSAVKFGFTPQESYLDNGFSGYAEIILEGTNSAPPSHGLSPYLTQDTLPAYAETVVGDQVTFTAAFSNSPPAALQWLVITNGVTNIVSGATSSTLTLNNLQVSNSGTYLLMATNTTDGTALPSYSTGAPLVVSNSPAPVNGVVVNYASQSFPSSATNFFPAWTINTSADLIHGFTSGSGPGFFTALGVHFDGDGSCNNDPTILSDGLIAPLTSLPTTSYSGCGPADVNVGVAMTYTLNSTPYGIDLTNITVFGGWVNGNRDEQKYRVLYSTVQTPSTFNSLVSADYLPANPNNQPTVSRTTLVPSSGVMVHNVAAVKISWDVSPLPKNNWEAYSEILVGGQPSTGLAPALTNDIAPHTASDVVGSQLIITAGFSGATSLQWQLNGTNVTGATSSTLTLNNLQLTNSGNYTLVASNANGVSISGACTVTVNPAPSATNNVITAIATQTSVAEVFTPTWNPSQLTSSLIYNTSPSGSGYGDFAGGFFAPGPYQVEASGPSVLTDGSYGTIDYDQNGDFLWITLMGYGINDANNNLVGGQYVTYTLPASANGYDITNIVTAGGWVDSGRDEQDYVVSYATAASPSYFIPIASVDYNPTNPAGYSMVRATITPASGVLASNVVALQFNMNLNDENGFSGYSQIAVYGSPSANAPAPGPVVTVANEQTTTPDWVVETPNLIAGQLPSASAGNFDADGNETVGLSVLTDGTLGNSADVSGFVSCGSTAGTSVTYTSTNGIWNLTNIVVYSGWANNGRDGQFYNVSYSTLSAPTTFIPLVSVFYNPIVSASTPSANRVDIAPPSGMNMLATNVYAVHFDFAPQLNTSADDNGWSGYSEIVLQGTSATVIPPTFNPTVSGGNLILMGTGGTPNAGYTVLTTTNLSPPVVWTGSATGNLDGTGAFSNAIPINVSQPDSFFRLRVP